MKVYTYPKIGIEREYKEGIDNSNNALISILSSVDSPLSEEIKKSYKYVLELRFDDLPFTLGLENIYNSESEFYHMIYFDSVHYQKICWFIKGDLRDFNGQINIHCTAGISRSGAVAVGVSLLRNDFALYEQIMRDNEIIPNQLALSYFIQDITSDNYWFDLVDMYKIILGGND